MGLPIESSVNGSESTVADKYNNESSPKPSSLSLSSSDRAFERWLFTDWLVDNKSEKNAGRRKEPALPILKSAKWNSGDNPVLVTALLMMIGIVFIVLTEQMASLGG